jgi:hypothetical protein
MNNELKNRILTERITELTGFSAELRSVVEASQELMDLIAENRILAGPDRAASHAAPARLAMLSAAMAAPPEQVKENTVTLFTKLFAGRHPLVQFGLATAALAVFAVAFLGFMSQSSTPAWSQTDGSVLEYTLGTLSGEDAMQDILDLYVAKIKEAKAALGGDASDKKTVQISVNVNAESTTPGVEPVPVASLVVSLLEDNPELLAMIQEKIAEIPGAPVPTVQSSTWFFGPEGPGQGGISFKVEGRVFNFPDTATEEEVEAQISGWLATTYPDEEYVVEITIERNSDAEGRESVKVMANIHKVGEEGHKVGAESPAHPPARR